jgi:hypothetical protein
MLYEVKKGFQDISEEIDISKNKYIRSFPLILYQSTIRIKTFKNLTCKNLQCGPSNETSCIYWLNYLFIDTILTLKKAQLGVVLHWLVPGGVLLSPAFHSLTLFVSAKNLGLFVWGSSTSKRSFYYCKKACQTKSFSHRMVNFHQFWCKGRPHTHKKTLGTATSMADAILTLLWTAGGQNFEQV